MFEIRSVPVAAPDGEPPLTGAEEQQFIAFAAERDGELAGFVVAESHPRVVRIVGLEGQAEACRPLLARLQRLAGERYLSVLRPDDRDVRRVIEERGFALQTSGLYLWRQYDRRYR